VTTERLPRDRGEVTLAPCSNRCPLPAG
jgi:hypothetical protein